MCVTIVQEKETIVKNRIARIKLECTFADFFQEFVGQNKLKNEVSRNVKIEIRETIEGTPFQISLEEIYACASQITKPKFFTFTLTENIDLSVSTEGAEPKSLYSVLMDRSFKVLKPLNVTNKKDELHNALLADILSDRGILGFSQNNGNTVFKLISDAVWYLDGRQKTIRLAHSFTSTITPIPEW